MASDRIGNKAAELVAVPPYEIIFTTTDRLLACLLYTSDAADE